MSTDNLLKTITVIGSGYVGVTSAALFANAGFKVYALEINPKRLAAIKRGKSFFYEEYLNPLLSRAVSSGSLVGTDSYEQAIPDSDVIFSCVGTPDNPDGSSNLSYVFASAREVAQYAKKGAVFAQKSTVPVGTGIEIEQLFREAGADIGYVSNPEFLREGTALFDSLWPDRLVVGGSSDVANKSVMAVYKSVIDHRNDIAKFVGMEIDAAIRDNQPRYLSTSRNSAELMKVSANAFLALKISFANSIAKLADAAGADVVEVMDGIGCDTRINRAFLSAGRGYGGGCFPKDVSGLISSGLKYGIDLQIMQAVSTENESMPGYLLEKVVKHLNGTSLAGKKVAVLGAAFKAGTSDMRRSPAARIVDLLISKLEANVYIHDPEAFKEEGFDAEINRNATIVATTEDAMKQAEIVVIATDWNHYKSYPIESYAELMAGNLIVDGMNCLDPKTVRAAGLNYIGVGR